MSGAFLSDARQLLSETFDGILETLDGLDADRLNAKLDLEGANSLAVIAVHASKSARTWSAVAMGAELPHRDRPAEFRTVVDSPASFLEELADAHREALAYLAAEPELPWDELRPTHPRADGSTERVTGSWALLHGMEHAREHLSQMSLTRQALEDGRLGGAPQG
ncbi:MAG: DinB family protein [Actinomycetota bacterium]